MRGGDPPRHPFWLFSAPGTRIPAPVRFTPGRPFGALSRSRSLCSRRPFGLFPARFVLRPPRLVSCHLRQPSFRFSPGGSPLRLRPAPPSVVPCGPCEVPVRPLCFPTVRRPSFRSPTPTAGSPVPDSDSFYFVALDQLCEFAGGSCKILSGRVGIYRFVVQQIALCVEAYDFAPGAEAGVDCQYPFLSQRRSQ